MNREAERRLLVRSQPLGMAIDMPFARSAVPRITLPGINLMCCKYLIFLHVFLTRGIMQGSRSMQV